MAGHRWWLMLVCFASFISLAWSATHPKCITLEQRFPDCSCYGVLDDQGASRVVVDCSGKSLTDVPQPTEGYSSIIYEMKLNNNNIVTLRDQAFSELKIERLDLSGNRISTVQTNAFDGVKEYLTMLHLSGDGENLLPKLHLTKLTELVYSNYNVPDLEGTTEHSFFLSLPSLRDLTLDNCRIESIEPGAFRLYSNAPFIHTLKSLTIINEPKLMSIPIDEFQEVHMYGLEKLKMSKTKISTVTVDAFSQLSELVELDLSENEINNLESGCFGGIGDTLTKLSVSKNVLSSSNLAGLQSLNMLQELDLSSNEAITTVPNLNLLGATRPLTLLLNNNKIDQLGSGAFNGIGDKLHTLNLDDNEIDSLDDNSFSGVTQLEVLRLSQQPSVRELRLPNSLVQSADTLRELYLNGHDMDTEVLWSVVRQLSQLEVLNLRATALSGIPDFSLRSLTSLRELYVDFNAISTITPKALVGPRNSLDKLYLGGNSIEKLSSCIFQGYSSFPKMTLQLNPLKCDCELKWLWTAIKDNAISFDGSNTEPKCIDNQLLSSKELSDFCPGNHQDAECENHYPSTDPTTTQGPDSQLRVVVSDITQTSMTVSWTISDTSGLQSFTIKASSIYIDKSYDIPDLPANIRMQKIENLRTDTDYTICVAAIYQTKPVAQYCTRHRTREDGGGDPSEQKGSSSEDLGIIIGSVVAGVVLLLILGAIVYLVFIRRRPRKETSSPGVGSQPRAFAKSELPTMSTDTRTFAKPKRVSGTGSDHHDGMQVVAISDGQTSNGRVGRAHLLNSDGTYRPRDTSPRSPSGGSYKVMGANSRSPGGSSSLYENDHGNLPPVPSETSGHSPPPSYPTGSGYYNMGFKNDKYDEIDGLREIVL